MQYHSEIADVRQELKINDERVSKDPYDISLAFESFLCNLF